MPKHRAFKRAWEWSPATAEAAISVINRSPGAADGHDRRDADGGSGRATTGSLAVTPGQTIDFRIGPVLSNSTVIIR